MVLYFRELKKAELFIPIFFSFKENLKWMTYFTEKLVQA